MNGIKKIFYQSLPALVISSSFSSIGGIGLSMVRTKILFILPLLILFPALNDMVGDYGTILASKFTTWFYRGTIPSHWYRSKRLKILIRNILAVAIFYSLVIASLTLLISHFENFPLTATLTLKIFLIAMIATFSLVWLLSLLIFSLGMLLYRRKVDPDNNLIPFATSLADLGTLFIFTLLVHLFF